MTKTLIFGFDEAVRIVCRAFGGTRFEPQWAERSFDLHTSIDAFLFSYLIYDYLQQLEMLACVRLS